MAIRKNGSGPSSGFIALIFALAGLAGTAASLYAMVLAYLAGSSAQANIDGCPQADPLSLARSSMEELARNSGAPVPADDVITVNEEEVEVRNAALCFEYGEKGSATA